MGTALKPTSSAQRDAAIDHLLGRRDYASALPFIRETLRTSAHASHETLSGTWSALSMALYGLTRFAESACAARIALALSQDNGEAWEYLGLNFLSEDDASAAHRAFNRAIAIEERFPPDERPHLPALRAYRAFARSLVPPPRPVLVATNPAATTTTHRATLRVAAPQL